MKYLKLLLKILIGLVGLFIIIIIVLLGGESYETFTKKDGNEIIYVEVKKFFGKKISECPIDSNGFYHGRSISWDLFGNTIRSEGNYRNGYWHGRWKDYDRDGNLIMVREWNKGELEKVFTPMGKEFKEVPKEEWPKYVNVKQIGPQRIND